MSSFTKDPDATLDYAFDWTAWLDDGETIATHTIISTGTPTVDSSAQSGGIVTVWLSGGTTGTSQITCRITTSQGRIDDRTIRLRIMDR